MKFNLYLKCNYNKHFTMLMKTENDVETLSEYIDSPTKERFLLQSVSPFYPLLNKLQDNSIYEISQIKKEDAYYLINNTNELKKVGINLKLGFKCQRSNFSLVSNYTSDFKICTTIALNGKALKETDYMTLLKTNEQMVYIQDSFQIVEDFKSFEKYYNQKYTVKEFVKEFKEFPKLEINFDDKIKLPKFTDSRFKQHQLDAIDYIANSTINGRNVLLADDMGLGKTVTAIGVISKLNTALPNLIVCPKSVQENWVNEIKKFSSIDCETLTNESAIIPNKTYITTYGNISHNINDLKNYCFNTIVLDEAQQIKNIDTKTSESVRNLKSMYRLAMTGTPIENSLNDLYSIFYFINPNILGTRKDFAEITKNANYNDLIELLKPFIVRRLKTDKNINLNLPTKTETVIKCKMNETQINLYNNMINLYKSERKYNFTTILKYLTKLKMVCSYPQGYINNAESEKFNKLKNLIVDSNYQPFVIFTQYKDCAKSLVDNLNHIYYNKGALIDGDLSAKERCRIADDFQKGKYSFIVLTLKSGNCGLTLTKASNLVHYDRWWNPAVENQASDRIYRIGQSNDVNIYKFVSENTIEERIDDLINQKQILFNDVINEFPKYQNQLFQEINVQ